MAGYRLGRVIVVALLHVGCGGEDVAQQSEAIINGTPIAADSLPGVGLLLVEEATLTEFCTATLVSDRLLLTAAHCVAQIPTGSQVAFFTGSDISAPDAASQMLAVSSYAPNPAFSAMAQPPGTLADYHDIAVVQLAQPTTIAPVKMVRPAEVGVLLKTGSSMRIAGYGETAASRSSSVGTKVEGTTALAAVGNSEIMISRAPAAQTCDGDSGGPTLAGPADDLRVVGVTSRGDVTCSLGSFETRVDSYLTWIHSFGPIPCGSGLSAECPGQQDVILAQSGAGGCDLGSSYPSAGRPGAIPAGVLLWLLAAAARRRRRR
jgi:secreted trypsin-like serine protease